MGKRPVGPEETPNEIGNWTGKEEGVHGMEEEGIDEENELKYLQFPKPKLKTHANRRGTITSSTSALEGRMIQRGEWA